MSPSLYIYCGIRRRILCALGAEDPEGVHFVTREQRSGLSAGKAHGRGAGAVVGLDVDEADHAFLDLAPGALQGRADVLGLFDKFGVSARGLGHLVVACVAEIAAELVAL
jgi:hypothetical protein